MHETRPITRNLTVRQLKADIDSYKDNFKLGLGFNRTDINLDPDWQRDDVWNLHQRQKLIKTIFKFWKIPSLTLLDNGEFLESVDGKQRTLTILAFIDDIFETDDDMENPDLNNKKFSELSPKYRSDFLTSWDIGVDIYKNLDDDDVAELFALYNNGQKLSRFDKFNGEFSSNTFYIESKKFILNNKINNIEVGKFFSYSDKSFDQYKKRNMLGPTYCSLFNGLLLKKLNLKEESGYSHKITEKILNQLKFNSKVEIQDLFNELNPKIEKSLSILGPRTTRNTNLVLYTDFVSALATKDIKKLPARKKEIKKIFQELQKFIDDPTKFTNEFGMKNGTRDSVYQTKLRDKIHRELDLCLNSTDTRFFNNQQREEIKSRDKVCVNCGDNHLLEIDHNIPYSKGGNTSISNAQLLCKTCNTSKSNNIKD